MTLLQEVAASLSTARLGAFRLGTGEANEIVLGRYLWNVALAGALYPTIHFLEVALRNSFHGAIAMLAGPTWYENNDVLVNVHAHADIADAKQRILEAGRTIDTPRVIAALDLGFWAGLCNRQYEQGPAMPPTQIALWPALLRPLGPLLPVNLRTRAALSEYLGRVRIIRNRAYHHEPLWRGQADRRGHVVPLSVDHARMQEMVNALSPRAGQLLRLCDRFTHIYDRGLDPWVSAVGDLCRDAGIAP